jgi:hypothetical protein
MVDKIKIEFLFNNISDKFIIPLKYLLESEDSLKKIIKNKCIHINIILFEENIILYDELKDTIINTVQDLVENKTKICKIIIKPINY